MGAFYLGFWGVGVLGFFKHTYTRGMLLKTDLKLQPRVPLATFLPLSLLPPLHLFLRNKVSVAYTLSDNSHTKKKKFKN